MATERHNRFFIFSLCVFFILIAVICRAITYIPHISKTHKLVSGYIRSFIYISLFLAWGISLNMRIVNMKIKKLLIFMSILILFWMITRTLRYYFVTDTKYLRLLWYAYYIPLLLFPSVSLLVALYTGKSEDYQLSKWVSFIPFIAAFLALLVLGNDLHQAAFRFIGPLSQSDDYYFYGPLYYICCGWSIITGVGTIFILIKRCLLPRSKKVLYAPFIPIIILIIYSILYIFKTKLLLLILGDMTVFFCLFFIATIECCIQCKLIQVNTHYKQLFYHSTNIVGITDEALQIRYNSSSTLPLQKSNLAAAVNAPVELRGMTRLLAAKIRGGYIFWKEDISEISKLLNELAITQNELEGAVDLLRAENELKEKKQRLTTMNYLYNRISRETVSQSNKINIILEKVSQKKLDPRTALKQICVLGAYIKRRSNLILLSEESNQVSGDELCYCIQESFDNLEAVGISCILYSQIDRNISVYEALALYDLFESIIEIPDSFMTSIAITLTVSMYALNFRMMLGCDKDQTVISQLPQYKALIRYGGKLRIMRQNEDLYIVAVISKGDDPHV